MTNRKFVGLLVIFAMGIPSVVFSKEAAWWTRHKQVCELPQELMYQDWLAQGSPCELNAIAERKERENARRNKIREAEQEAQRKVMELAQEKARKEEQLLAQEEARQKEIQLAEERARKKEIQLAKKIARDKEKQLAEERALEKRIQLAAERARKKEIQLAKKNARDREKQLAKEKALEKKIQLAAERARKKEIQRAEKIARDKKKQLAKQLAKKKALEKKIQLAAERARKKEIQRAEKIARDKEKQLAKQRASEKKIQLAKEKAELKGKKADQSFVTNSVNEGASQPVNRKTSDVAKPYVSAVELAAESIAFNVPAPRVLSATDSTSMLLARMVKHSRSLDGVGEVAADACAGLGLCDGSANMPLKLVVGNTPSAKVYFGVPLAENATEILIMVESGTLTEVYLTDLSGTLWASAISDSGSDRSITYKESSVRFASALEWFVQAARELKPTN
jgi:hypothetical protein